MTRIYLIRHGQTEWNAAGRWQGTLDVDLSPIGLAQAHKLAAYVRGWPIAAVYASDLSRAAVTAQIVAAALGVQAQLDPRWREFDLGVLQGLTHDEIRQQYPQELQGLHDNYLDHHIQGGESRRMLMQRAGAALDDILARNEPHVAIVSHGGTIRVLLHKLLNGDAIARGGSIGNTSITTVDIEAGQVHLRGLGEAPHLIDPADSVVGGEASKL